MGGPTLFIYKDAFFTFLFLLLGLIPGVFFSSPPELIDID